MNLEQWFEDKFEHYGLTAALIVVVVYAWRFLQPKIDVWFNKHFTLVDTLQAKLDKRDTHSEALCHLGESIHASTDDTRKPAVRPHLEALHRSLKTDKEQPPPPV
jgi:hypothetical protein